MAGHPLNRGRTQSTLLGCRQRETQRHQVHAYLKLLYGNPHVPRRASPHYLLGSIGDDPLCEGETSDIAPAGALRGNPVHPVQHPGQTFDDPRVTHALAAAIDRKTFIENILQGGQVPAYGITPPFRGYETPEVVGFDPEKARRLLAEAGYPDGDGFPEVKFLTTDRDGARRNAETFQAMFCLLYTSPSPRDRQKSRMPSSA